jgi:hypothetical protein
MAFESFGCGVFGVAHLRATLPLPVSPIDYERDGDEPPALDFLTALSLCPPDTFDGDVGTATPASMVTAKGSGGRQVG